MKKIIVLVMFLALLAGCNSQQQREISDLQSQVEDLQSQVEALTPSSSEPESSAPYVDPALGANVDWDQVIADMEAAYPVTDLHSNIIFGRRTDPKSIDFAIGLPKGTSDEDVIAFGNDVVRSIVDTVNKNGGGYFPGGIESNLFDEYQITMLIDLDFGAETKVYQAIKAGTHDPLEIYSE